MASCPLVSQLRLHKALLCTAAANVLSFYIHRPLGSPVSPLVYHIFIVSLGLAAFLTSTTVSVVLLDLPMERPAAQDSHVPTPHSLLSFHLLLPNFISLPRTF